MLEAEFHIDAMCYKILVSLCFSLFCFATVEKGRNHSSLLSLSNIGNELDLAHGT